MPINLRADQLALSIALIGAAAILGAWVFQYGFGYPPCPLCFEQRYAYYFSIPLAVLLWLGSGFGAQRKVMVVGFVAIAVGMLYNAGLGAYHAGVEWQLWPGPADCSGALGDLGGGGGLLQQLQNTRVVRCDAAAWRFLGLSLAGYNVLISLALAALAILGSRGAFVAGRNETD